MSLGYCHGSTLLAKEHNQRHQVDTVGNFCGETSDGVSFSDHTLAVQFSSLISTLDNNFLKDKNPFPQALNIISRFRSMQFRPDP